MTRNKEKRRRKRGRRKNSLLTLLDDPREPIRRGVPSEPRLRRDRFSFLCLTDMTIFQTKPNATQDRIVNCPKCHSSEDIVIYT